MSSVRYAGSRFRYGSISWEPDNSMDATIPGEKFWVRVIIFFILRLALSPNLSECCSSRCGSSLLNCSLSFASPWSGCFLDTLKGLANTRVCLIALMNQFSVCPAVQFTIRTQFRRAYLWGTANNETWAYSGQGREKDDIQVFLGMFFAYFSVAFVHRLEFRSLSGMPC